MNSERSIEVSTGTLLSMTTGRLVTESFSDMHAAADVVMGQPLMTHQFASQAVADQIEREAKRQHPWTADPLIMDDFPSMEGLSREQAEQACRAWVQQHTAKHGDSHLLVSPPETRHVPLMEGLPAKFGGAS